jgi:hypothetical protein
VKQFPDWLKIGFPVTCSTRTGIWLDSHLVVDGVQYPLPGAQVPSVVSTERCPSRSMKDARMHLSDRVFEAIVWKAPERPLFFLDFSP